MANTQARAAPNIRVSHVQFVRLVEWLRTPDVLKGTKYYADVSERACKALGFPVSAHTVADALEASGVKMPEDSYVASRQKGNALPEEVAALRKELAEAKEALAAAITRSLDLAVAVAQAFLLENCVPPGTNPHKKPPPQLNELKARTQDIGQLLLQLEAFPATLEKAVVRSGNTPAKS